MESNDSPKEPRLRLFALMERYAKLPGLRTGIAVIRFLFVELAPSLPKTRVFSLTGRGRVQIFFCSYLVAFIFCFVVTAVWSASVGTFAGSNPDIRYFTNDWQNILLYTLVCPSYVGFGTVLIASVMGGFWELRQLEEEVGASPPEVNGLLWKGTGVVVFILAAAFLSTSLYISDVTDLERVGFIYWFVEEIQPGEVRLTSLGVYYFLLNFTLLLITLASLAFFMSAFAATIRVAKALTSDSQSDCSAVTLKSMKTKLQTFVGAYLAAKLQIGVYIINFWIWQKSPLGNTSNLFVAHVFLVLVGVFFLAIPRDYIELQWRRFQRMTGEAKPEDLNVEQLVEGRAAVWAMAIDSLLIGSIIYIPFISELTSY